MFSPRYRALHAALLALIGTILVSPMSPPIVKAAQSSAVDQSDRVDVLIAFRNTPGPDDEALVRGVGGRVKHRYHLIRAIATSIPRRAMSALLANPRVAAVEPDGKVFAVDAELDNSWGVKRIGAGSVHANGIRGTGVKVAILDTGIDYTHPDLAANYAGGWDFVNNDDDPFDDNKHDTTWLERLRRARTTPAWSEWLRKRGCTR